MIKKIIQVKLVLNIKVNDSFNNLKDEALIGNKIKTNSLISETEIEPEKNILYLNIINQRLLKLLEIYKLSTNSNLEDAISRIKPPIFWKDKDSFLKQAKKLNKKKIQNLLDKTHNLEFILKTNATVKQNTLIKNLLVEMCVLANS